MKIKSLTTTNFSHLYGKVEVSFDENITYLIGKNGAGKSTIGITAIWATFQGIAEKSKTALIGERFRFIGDSGVSSSTSLVLHDEKKNVDITVTNRITKSGNELSFKAPENYPVDKAWLENLFNIFLLAPKKFIELSSKQQAEALGIDTSTYDESIKALKAEFTLINRDLTNLGQIVPVEKVDKVDILALNKEKDEILSFNKAQEAKTTEINKAKEGVTTLETQVEETTKQITELQNQIALLVQKKTTLNTRIATGNKYVKELPQPLPIKPVDDIDNKINNTTETNQKAFKYEQYLLALQKQKDVEAKIAKNKADQAVKQRERTDYIRNQKLPFDNLTISEEGDLLLSGKPIKEPYFSTGELLMKVPVLMASRNPELKYVFLQDFNLLDEDTQEAVEKVLVDQGMQLVIELVGTKPIAGKNCILLKDCKVVDSFEQSEERRSL